MATHFDATTTADEVLEGIDLHGKRFLLTGVSSGVGAETARALVARGAAVVGVARNAADASSALDDIRAAAERGSGSLDIAEADLSSLSSVRACADLLTADDAGFDVVIANAGVMATPFGRTADGFETQFGINHLGHFVLVNRIAPLLRAGGRMVSLSSNGHRGADVDLDDPNFERTDYDPWVAYGRSKTANSLFAVEFDRRHRNRGIRACSVMPGTAMTPLLRNLSEDDLKSVFTSIDADRTAAGGEPLVLKSVAQMAATPVWAAVVAHADTVGGRYLENCQVAEVDALPGIRDGVMPYALDPERAQLLWARSEELVGEEF